MVGSSLPSLNVQTISTPSAYNARSLSNSSAVHNDCHSRDPKDLTNRSSIVEALLTCTIEGNIVSLFGPRSPCNDTDVYEEDCLPVEEVSSRDIPHHYEGRTPSVAPECETFSSADLPLPRHAAGLCHSPLEISSCSTARAQTLSKTCSFASSAASTGPDSEARTSVKTPCRCPFVVAHRVMEAAKRCASAHLKAYSRTYTMVTLPNGKQMSIMPQWADELIARKTNQAYESCVVEIRRVAEIARPNGWPIHDSKFPMDQYSGHVQPWMRAIAQRHASWAVNAVIKDIEECGGFTTSACGQFCFSAAEVQNPHLLRHACQCKENHARNIAFRVLEDTMTNLAPFISTLVTYSPKEDRVTMHSRVWSLMKSRIQTAMLSGLGEITEAEDIIQLCSEHEMTHVRPWMTRAIKQHCQLAAIAESKKLRWRARDVHINWFQDWLEMLYRQDAEDDVMMEGSQRAGMRGN